MIAVAALAAAAGSASAEELKADIPFTFRAGKALMQPGTYELKMAVSDTRSFFLLRNTDTNTSVLVANFNQGDVPKDWQAKGKPIIAFECYGQECVLRDLWSGRNGSAYHFNGPKLGRDGDSHIASIAMRPSKGD